MADIIKMADIISKREADQSKAQLYARVGIAQGLTASKRHSVNWPEADDWTYDLYEVWCALTREVLRLQPRVDPDTLCRTVRAYALIRQQRGEPFTSH
jgi:hypothetical protein